MSRWFLASVAVLALAAAWTIDDADAQARGPSTQRQNRNRALSMDESAARAQKLAELDAWLRRLVGRYRYSGNVTTGPLCDEPRQRAANVICRPLYSSLAPVDSEVEGVGDCVGFSTGPGVYCLIDVTWQRGGWSLNGPWDPTLSPAMILYGLDPDALQIRYLQVDNLSIADSALGSLDGDTVSFRTSCANQDPNVRSCARNVRMSASPDGQTIRMSIDVTFRLGRMTYDHKIYFRLLLERLPPTEAGEISSLPSRYPQQTPGPQLPRVAHVPFNTPAAR